MAVETGSDNIDDLMMGNVSEEASESDEKFAQRLAAAQVKLKKIAKDEKKAKGFDGQLAKLIKILDHHILQFVVFLVNHDVPSLTILALISLESKESKKICHDEFFKHIEESADFSMLEFNDEIKEEISYWWTFILAADHVSTSSRLSEYNTNSEFKDVFFRYLRESIFEFLNKKGVQKFSKDSLERVLRNYEKELLDEKK